MCKVLCNKLSRFLWIFLRMRVFVCPFTIFLLFTSFDLGVVPQKAKPPHFLNIWLRLDNGALCLHWESSLGKGSNNQNGNLRWFLSLDVRPPPPPLNGTNFQTFLTPLFSFAIESYIYETDFTFQKYHF